MTDLSNAFFSQVETYKIDLNNDTADYLRSLLADLSLDSPVDEVRGVTEVFLEDAEVPKATIDALYNRLETAMAKSGTPAPQAAQNDAITSARTLPVPVEDASSDKISLEDTSKKARTTKRTPRRTRKQKQEAAAGGMADDDKPPTIVATSQQSRFHAETLETLSKDIDLKQVNISVNDNALLVDAHLRLKENVRYGFVGPNGSGKSVLMKCLGENLLIGLPQNLQILYVAQLETDQDVSVLDEVLSSDRESLQITKDYEFLKAAMSTTSADKDNDMKRAVHQLLIEQSDKNLVKLHAIATKRSGARGWDARNELVDAEAAHKKLVAQDPLTFVTAELMNETVSEVMTKASLVDRDAQLAKAGKILGGLGFTDEEKQQKVAQFSGGWRMRIALAKALFVDPNILLLDEPTNHLDLPAILWLREYILTNTSEMTVVIVSHDREFLSSVTEETIILKDKQLRYHAGNFDDYEQNTEEQRVRKQRLLDNQEKKKKKLQASIQNDIKRAKASGDDKRLGQVASRTKKLDRLGMEKTEDGKRFKVSYRVGWHDSSHVQIVVDQKDKTNAINIPDPAPLRSTGPFLSLEQVSFRYTPKGPDVVQDVTFCLEPHSRLALLGPNGSGKSTLLDLITGKLQPTKGTVRNHPLLRIGYFTQHVVDALDANLTPVDLLRQKDPSLSEQDCFTHLGSVGMGAYGTRPVKHMSGGQRSRVVLAILTFDQPHVLILDEITNHLDMGTVDVLVEALDSYTGSLILVSHDVWFMKQLLEPERAEDADDDEHFDKMLKTEVYALKTGQFKRWEKGMDAYVQQTLRKVQRQMA